jgi:hypothetical protein
MTAQVMPVSTSRRSRRFTLCFDSPRIARRFDFGAYQDPGDCAIDWDDCECVVSVSLPGKGSPPQSLLIEAVVGLGPVAAKT